MGLGWAGLRCCAVQEGGVYGKVVYLHGKLHGRGGGVLAMEEDEVAEDDLCL